MKRSRRILGLVLALFAGLLVAVVWPGRRGETTVAAPPAPSCHRLEPEALALDARVGAVVGLREALVTGANRLAAHGASRFGGEARIAIDRNAEGGRALNVSANWRGPKLDGLFAVGRTERTGRAAMVAVRAVGLSRAEAAGSLVRGLVSDAQDLVPAARLARAPYAKVVEKRGDVNFEPRLESVPAATIELEDPAPTPVVSVSSEGVAMARAIEQNPVRDLGWRLNAEAQGLPGADCSRTEVVAVGPEAGRAGERLAPAAQRALAARGRDWSSWQGCEWDAGPATVGTGEAVASSVAAMAELVATRAQAWLETRQAMVAGAWELADASVRIAAGEAAERK
jgi:hypothetical protein